MRRRQGEQKGIEDVVKEQPDLEQPASSLCVAPNA
jgi:hypothetical protein